MELHLDKSGDPWILRPEGEMTIYAAAEIKAPMLAALDGAPGLSVDLSALEELDTSGLQLLMLLAREARAGGTPLTLGELSQPAAEAIDLAHARARIGGTAS